MKDPVVPQELTISTRKLTETIVVSLAGESDMANATALRTCLCKTLNRWQQSVVVDLSGLTFMDTSGLSALIAAYRRASQLDCQLVLAAPTRQAAKVLDVTSMGRVLPIYDTVPEACLACSRSAGHSVRQPTSTTA